MANEKQEHRKNLDEIHSYVTEHMKPSGIKPRRQKTTMCIGRVSLQSWALFTAKWIK